MTERAVFRASDFTRAVRAMKRAGEQIKRIDIEPTGKISIFPANDLSEDEGRNPWDEE